MSDIIYNARWAQDMMDKYDAIRAENAALKRENEALTIARQMAMSYIKAGREEDAYAVLEAALSRPSSDKAKQ